MTIDPQHQSPQDIYKLMVGAIVPRPIAFVSTLDAKGQPNLAPFSFFTAISANPPVICFSPMIRSSDGQKKDTLRNVEATREFVVNVVDDALAAQMNVTSGDYPPEVDEFEVAGLAVAAATRVAPPRVADAPIAMECRLDRIVPVGRANLVLGRIVHLHVRDGLYDPTTGRVDMHRLRPVGRLAGNLYTHVHDIFEMKRPTPDYRG